MSFAGGQGGPLAGQVDRLIERGLDRYGLGDVDGALALWEQALALDPEDLRAAAYVDYVRENHELLLRAPRDGEDAVPFGLDAVPGEDAYDVEVTIGGGPRAGLVAGAASGLDRFIAEASSAIDDGWFLDEDPAAGAGEDRTGNFTPAPPAPGDVDDAPLEVDDAPLALDAGPDAAALAARPSLRQLPLPAMPADEPELTLEIEADEPDDVGAAPLDDGLDLGLGPAGVAARFGPPGIAPDDGASAGAGGADGGADGGDDEQTGDFGVSWRASSADHDFADQRSAAPTREIPAPRGFARLPGVAPLVVPRPDPGRDDDAVEGTEDDRLRTRPGRSPVDPIESARSLGHGLAPEALADFGGGTGTGAGRVGPDDRTRETPLVRVTFAPDTQDLELDRGDLAGLPGLGAPGGDDERTTERAARADTLAEPTVDRTPGARQTQPAPLDESADVALDAHPPLVIIEDPVLAGGPPRERGDAGGDLELGAAGSGDGAAPPAGGIHEAFADLAFQHAEPTREEVRRARIETTRLEPLRARDLDPTTPPPSRAPAAPAAPAASPGAAAGLDDLAARLEDELDRGAPAGEAPGDRTRRRLGALLDRAAAASARGEHADAVVALDRALAEDPDSAVAQKLLRLHQAAILDVYQRFLGELSARPGLAMPMHELSDQRLDIRAAFLLSRIDGTLTFEEILDVSGMPRPEALRHLSMLVLRGILAVR